VLRQRLNARVTHPDRDWDQAAREFGMTGADEMVAAAARQPGGTLMLRSDKLIPAEQVPQQATLALGPAPHAPGASRRSSVPRQPRPLSVRSQAGRPHARPKRPGQPNLTRHEPNLTRH
jgi:hypothetical protein